MEKSMLRNKAKFLMLLISVSLASVQESWSHKVDCPEPQDIQPVPKGNKWTYKGNSIGSSFIFRSIREYDSPDMFENANFMGVEKRNNQLFCRYRTARRIILLTTNDAAVKHCTEAPLGGDFTYFDCP
jgi:hypothetical protein